MKNEWCYGLQSSHEFNNNNKKHEDYLHAQSSTKSIIMYVYGNTALWMIVWTMYKRRGATFLLFIFVLWNGKVWIQISWRVRDNDSG